MTAQHILSGTGAVVHIAGCASFNGRRWAAVEVDPPAKPAKLLTSSGIPWVPKRPAKYNRKVRKGPTNYMLRLQFYFERPMNIELWKRIKAPRGWRKCPTGREQQSKVYGVRFQCRDYKHALTPDEIEELRARLYFCLETVF